MHHVTIETPNQKDRNAITYWFLLPGGGVPVYIYIYIYIYVYIYIYIDIAIYIYIYIYIQRERSVSKYYTSESMY